MQPHMDTTSIKASKMSEVYESLLGQREKDFWSKVKKTKSCWNWKKSLRNGYSVFHIPGLNSGYGHIFSYILLVGKIPDGLVIDHLCRNRGCVNPKHMELVTLGENSLRGLSLPAINLKKKVCVNGHEFSKENTLLMKDYRGNFRRCKECNRTRARNWMRKNRYGM